MERIENQLFQKIKMSDQELFLFKGGHKTKPTVSQTAKYDSTWYFFEDDNGNTQTDTTDDLDLGILPAVPNISSR